MPTHCSCGGPQKGAHTPCACARATRGPTHSFGTAGPCPTRQRAQDTLDARQPARQSRTPGRGPHLQQAGDEVLGRIRLLQSQTLFSSSTTISACSRDTDNRLIRMSQYSALAHSRGPAPSNAAHGSTITLAEAYRSTAPFPASGSSTAARIGGPPAKEVALLNQREALRVGAVLLDEREPAETLLHCRRHGRGPPSAPQRTGALRPARAGWECFQTQVSTQFRISNGK